MTERFVSSNPGQEKSEFFPRGDGNGTEPGLIARIFFRFDDAQLDDHDHKVIERAGEVLKMQLFGSRPVRAQVSGHADSRGDASYNAVLARRRAGIVQRLLNSHLGGSRVYSSTTVSLGERQATGKRSYDRRVDIKTNYQKVLRFRDDEIVVHYRGPLSDEFKVRILAGASLSLPVPGPISLGASSLYIEVVNVRNHGIARFLFVGVAAGPSFKVGFNRPSDYSPMRSVEPIALKHLEGGGGMNTLSVVADSGTVLIFDGPRENGVVQSAVQVSFGGWDLNLGAAVVRGSWKRL